MGRVMDAASTEKIIPLRSENQIVNGGNRQKRISMSKPPGLLKEGG
jgi:hypothetical protein